MAAFNQWVVVDGCGAMPTSLLTSMELLPITTQNRIPPIQFDPTGGLFQLIVNGSTFTPDDGSFTFFDKTISWTSSVIAVNPGDTVVAVYTAMRDRPMKYGISALALLAGALSCGGADRLPPVRLGVNPTVDPEPFLRSLDSHNVWNTIGTATGGVFVRQLPVGGGGGGDTNIAQWGGVAVGAMTNYGTAPSGLFPGVNAYITNIPHVIIDSGGGTFTWPGTATPTTYGTAPGGTVPAVNAFVTNPVGLHMAWDRVSDELWHRGVWYSSGSQRLCDQSVRAHMARCRATDSLRHRAHFRPVPRCQLFCHEFSVYAGDYRREPAAPGRRGDVSSPV